MTTLKDHLRIGSDDDVRDNLLKCSKQILAISEAIPVRPVDDFIGYASQRVLKYISVEVEHSAASLKSDINQFSWRTRNIFESFLILKFVLSSEDNAKLFIAQKIGDEDTILEGMLVVKRESNDHAAPVKERISMGKSILSKNRFDKASPWQIKLLANKVGMNDEYNAFYKLFSKYVHPSSWVIISENDEYDNDLYWQTFIINAQLYCHYCCHEGNEFLKSLGIPIIENS